MKTKPHALWEFEPDSNHLSTVKNDVGEMIRFLVHLWSGREPVVVVVKYLELIRVGDDPLCARSQCRLFVNPSLSSWYSEVPTTRSFDSSGYVQTFSDILAMDVNVVLDLNYCSMTTLPGINQYLEPVSRTG